MPTMTQEQIEAFLREPHHAVVGTNRVDGPPQLSPVWYLYEDGRFYFTTWKGAAKYRNLARDPRISLCIDGGAGDYRSVIVYGVATPVDPSDPLLDAMRWRITRRYYDTDEDARRYLESEPPLDTVLFVVTPAKVISQDYS